MLTKLADKTVGNLTFTPMKSIEELQLLYNNELKQNLELLEGKRKQVLKKILLIVLVTALVVTAFLMANNYPILTYLGIAGILLAIYFIYKAVVAFRTYRKEFKEKVVREIVKLINPEWNYEPNGHISEGNYMTSKLFTKLPDRYKGDDLVAGVIEKTDFRMSELHSEYKTESTDKDGNRRTTWHTIFKGLFAHIDFNKEIKGETFVLPDTAERLFGKFGQKLQSMSSRGKLIKLENVEFEKLFVVYGADQIEARYILTPTMMEAMVNIQRLYKTNVFFSFIGSRVYFAMSFSKDLFEPRVFKSGVRFDDIKQMNDQFRVIQTIISEMNLNTRIWTKE